jgi:hypothetical protein
MNLCINNVVVTGAAEDIAHFKQTCVRLDEEGKPCFDFNSLIPMPAIIKDTIMLAGGFVDDALLVLGRGDLVENPRPLEELMKSGKVSNIEALKEKICPEAFENARRSIEAFEQTGAPNWYVWANRNWGTQWNAYDFKIIKEEPGRYEFRFETACRPPEPVYAKLAETFPNLSFETNWWDYERDFDCDEETENYDCCESCILVEGPAWGDAEFYGKWLLSAAKANELLQQAKRHDSKFANAIEIIELLQELDFGIMATIFLSRFADKEFQTFIIDFESGDLLDFVLMVEMGFFVQTGNRYQMTVPEKLDIDIVKQAHLKLAETDDENWIHPERFAVDLPFSQAKIYQRLLREMGEDERLADRRALLFLD